VHLVVGLGNPGETYRQSRHNLGFMVVDQVAESHSIAVSRRRFRSLWGQGNIADCPVILVKPQTFMNRSGEAVAALMAYFKLSLQQLMIVHDDLDLAFGQMKIVPGGGAGGHLGVQSIHETLEDDRYTRLKVGIGRPRFGEAVEDYVLSPWYHDQRDQVTGIVKAAAVAVTAILTSGVEKAMTVVNANRPPLSGT
jgi:PTH1 family peptidyl-tRNA hydrolase